MSKTPKRIVSPTLEVLRLMSDGKQRSPVEMSTDLDMPLNQVTNALQRLRKNNCLRLMSTPYQMTPTGQERLKARVAEAQRKAAKAAAEEATPRRPVGRPRIEPEPTPILPRPGDAFHHVVVPAPAESDPIVHAAVLGRHPLQMAWGSAHA